MRDERGGRDGFYVLLGVATVVSARLWSGLLDRMRGGQALAVLNGLLAVATLMPAVFAQRRVAFVSGVLFGATFLSAVASTTAFVRHNPPARMGQGISAFTIVFAFGQIVGPMVIGWVSDGAGLARRARPAPSETQPITIGPTICPNANTIVNALMPLAQ